MTKSNKVSKSNKKNKSNKSNKETNNISGENKSQETPNNTFVTVSFDTFVTLKNDLNLTSNKDKIKGLLYYSPGLTIKQLEEKFTDLKEKISDKIIKSEIQRNKDIFQSIGKVGKELVYDISEIVRKLITTQVQYKKDEEARIEAAAKIKKTFTETIVLFFDKIIKNSSIFSFSTEENISFINLQSLKEEELEIFESFLNNPEETINVFEERIKEMKFSKSSRIRFSNLDSLPTKTIEEIRSKDLNKLIKINAKVSKTSDVRPQVVAAKFECPSCGTIISVMQLGKKFQEAKSCSCGRKGFFKLISKQMVDGARIVLQDHFNNSSYNQKNINCLLQEDLVSHNNFYKFNPGNDVKIMGILKEIPIPLTFGVSTRSDLAIDVSSFEEINPKTNLEDLSEEKIKEFTDLSKKIDEKGLEVLCSSFAPIVYDYNYIKKALMLQQIQRKNDISRETRDKSNILLIGDTGVAKSRLLSYANKINHESIFGSCTGVTHVGLTAAAEKDDYGWLVKPGLMALARDLAILDEFNHIPEDDKPKLQQALNEMKIDIHKATIHTSIPVTGGVLAAANPIKGNFDPMQPIIPQFNLFKPILNRFDLVFVIRDFVKEERDKKISLNILRRNKLETEYSSEFITDYFLFIKTQEEPTISDEMEELISKRYSEHRKLSKDVTGRLTEAIERLAKASAKFRLSKFVEEKDLQISIDLIRKSYYFDDKEEEMEVKVEKIK